MLGRSNTAFRVLRKARQACPRGYNIGFALATILRDQGDRPASPQIVDGLLNTYPDESSLLQLRRQLVAAGTEQQVLDMIRHTQRWTGALLLTLLAACGGREDAGSAPRPLESPAAPGSAEPHLAVAPDGRAVLSWLEPQGEGVALRFSVLDSGGWGPPGDVAAGNDWFVNWADFPSVVPVSANVWAAHWLRKTPGSPYAYDVRVALSPDAGSTWAEPFTLHDDGTASEHGFVSLFAWDDDVGAVWLDGRETLTDDPFDAQMTLRSARIAADGRKLSEVLVDGRVCDCCQTDVAVGEFGPVAVYRDRDADEIRDIYVSRFVDGSWTQGVPVADDGWEIAGCPVNGPAVAAEGGRVVVSWFTAANEDTKVRLAFSADGGRSFGTPIEVDVGTPIGRVGVTPLGGEAVLVTWMTNKGNQRADILARRYLPDGSSGPTIVIASTSAARQSGFPQTVRTGRGDVVFAWTEVGADRTAVRTAAAATSVFEL